MDAGTLCRRMNLLLSPTTYHLPPTSMALTFIGFRGCGKSTIGAAVADRLIRPFVDADAEIEHRAGRSIREIFASDGEAGFRELERLVMADLLADEKLVIAAGGGAVLSAETRERMRRSGPVVYLRVTANTAERRIAGDASTGERRPALTNLPPRSEIEWLLETREPLYEECATLTLDADDRSVEDLIEAVLSGLTAEHGREAAT